MRPSAIVAIALAIAALIMSLLVLLAGKDPNNLKNIYVLNIKTTGIAGNVDLIPESNNGFLDRIGDRIDEFAGGVADKAVNALGVHDLYSWKVMTFCTGDQSLQETRDGKSLDIQRCGRLKPGMSFDLKQKLEDDLFEGQELPFEFPQDAEQANDILKGVSKAMGILYIIGVALTGLTVLMSILGLFISSRIFAFLTSIVAFLAFISLGVASGLLTALMVKLHEEFTRHLSQYGFSFSKSKLALGLTWAAVGCMLVVTLFWFFSICCGPRKNRDPAPMTTRKTGGGGLFGRRSRESRRRSTDPMVAEEGRYNEKTYAQKPSMMTRMKGLFARRRV
jgi:hypothetical protein